MSGIYTTENPVPMVSEQQDYTILYLKYRNRIRMTKIIFFWVRVQRISVLYSQPIEKSI